MVIKNLILQTIIPVIESAKYVSINKEQAKIFAGKLLPIELPPWDHDLQLLSTQEDTLQYYFFVDSINFCFWATKGKVRWGYMKNGVRLTGYYAFSYAIKKAVEAKPRLLSAEYLAKIPFDEFLEIFKDNGGLLLMKERHTIINENFSILSDFFGGKVSELVRQANGNVNHLVQILLDKFPSFNDFVEFKSKRVYFLKRAQLFCSDIFNALGNEDLGRSAGGPA